MLWVYGNVMKFVVAEIQDKIDKINARKKINFEAGTWTEQTSLMEMMIYDR